MNYTSKEQLTNFVGEKLLREATDKSHIGVIDEDSLQLAIDKATGTVDGYLGAVVALPLSSTPKAVKGYADILALYYLYWPRPPAVIAEGYDRVISELEEIRDGKRSLGIDPGGSPYITNPAATVESDPQVLTQQRMENFLDNPNSYSWPYYQNG